MAVIFRDDTWLIEVFTRDHDGVHCHLKYKHQDEKKMCHWRVYMRHKKEDFRKLNENEKFMADAIEGQRFPSEKIRKIGNELVHRFKGEIGRELQRISKNKEKDNLKSPNL